MGEPALVPRMRDLDVTDLSGIDSDYGGALHSRAQNHLRSSQGMGRYRRGRSVGKGGGYASESESKLRRRRGGTEPARGYHSEDEGRAPPAPLKAESSVEDLLGPGLGTATVLAVETGPGDVSFSSPSPSPAIGSDQQILASRLRVQTTSGQPLAPLNHSPRSKNSSHSPRQKNTRPKPPYRPPSSQFLVSQRATVSVEATMPKSPVTEVSVMSDASEADALRRAAQRVLYARPVVRAPPPSIFQSGIAPENIVVVPDSILQVSKDSECSDSSQGSAVPITQPYLHQ